MIYKLFAYPRSKMPVSFIDQEMVRVSQLAMGYKAYGPIRDVEAEDIDSAKELFLDLYWLDAIELGCYSGEWSVQQWHE